MTGGFGIVIGLENLMSCFSRDVHLPILGPIFPIPSPPWRDRLRIRPPNHEEPFNEGVSQLILADFFWETRFLGHLHGANEDRDYVWEEGFRDGVDEQFWS